MRRFRLKDRSTISKGTYVLDHLLYCGAIGYDVYVLLPLMVGLEFGKKERVALICCMVAASLYGVIFTWNHNRKNRGVVLDVVIGTGLFVVCTVGRYWPSLTKCLVIATLSVSMILICMICCERITARNRVREIFIRVLSCTQVLRWCTAFGCVVMIVSISLLIKFGNNELLEKEIATRRLSAIIQIMRERTEYLDSLSAGQTEADEDGYMVVAAYGDNCQLSQNIDTIKKLRNDEEFQRLDYGEKCVVVTALIQCEARFLGLWKIDIQFVELPIETLGEYNNLNRTIYINSYYLDNSGIEGSDASTIMSTALHECRHAYQWMMCDLYISSTPEERNMYCFTSLGVAEWIENFEHYVEDNGTEYANQMCEQDARSYARNHMLIYYAEIDRLLEGSAD